MDHVVVAGSQQCPQSGDPSGIEHGPDAAAATPEGMDGNTACCQLGHQVILPRKDIGNLVLKGIAVTSRRSRTQQPLGTSRTKALDGMKHA